MLFPSQCYTLNFSVAENNLDMCYIMTSNNSHHACYFLLNVTPFLVISLLGYFRIRLCLMTISLLMTCFNLRYFLQ